MRSDPDFSRLTVAERIQLVEDLWDSVAAETGDPSLTAAQRTELERRLVDFEGNSEAAEPWEAVRDRLELRLSDAG